METIGVSGSELKDDLLYAKKRRWQDSISDSLTDGTQHKVTKLRIEARLPLAPLPVGTSPHHATTRTQFHRLLNEQHGTQGSIAHVFATPTKVGTNCFYKVTDILPLSAPPRMKMRSLRKTQNVLAKDRIFVLNDAADYETRHVNLDAQKDGEWNKENLDPSNC